MCYMDHRVFLPEDHKYRSNVRNFNGSIEDRPPPKLLTLEQISNKLKDVNNDFGRLQKKSNNGPWKKKSIFFELPYWKHNTLRHNLDVMHIEKNIFDSIIGTLLDIPGKTKDHKNACLDLKEMGIKKKLHPKEVDQGKKSVFAKTCFSMTAKEKTTFCSVLKNAKIPDGCASNISRYVQLTEKKVSGYKSHDAHFMLHYLLQVAVRSTMPNQKVIEVADLDILQYEIVETLCQFETISPPSFFDIMVHLPIHLVNEMRMGGPIQFRWMYFHSGVETRFTRITRNSDICDPHERESSSSCLNVGHPIGGKRKGEAISLDCKSRSLAHRYILFNHEDIQKFIREHETKNPNKRNGWRKAKSQGLDFVEWFKKRALLSDVSENLRKLSRGPNEIARCFSGYVINGYMFHTKQRNAKRKTQNSGVTLAAITESFSSTKDENPITQSITYYGLITEIIEVDYYGKLKFVLFRCDWFEVEEEKYGMTCVYFNKRCYMDDPFVLASQVHQCFYIQDPSDANKHYVMKSIPRDFFNMNEQ
ncbi:uncharacterized protein LOC127093034 [Lathyrus oleraceus]|uniref:uncharacterized protein LOC127093034 n=1 Tax=Pisum sativum TaxID=3888 RepID=UPI0021D1298C|nr:uncharacterized protein LOC127093034 [Pisum sativum]